MSVLPSANSAVSIPNGLQERIELANQLYQNYRMQCFWHCPRDLVITEELLPFVVAGLRKHGDRQAFIMSGKLQPHGAD